MVKSGVGRQAAFFVERPQHGRVRRVRLFALLADRAEQTLGNRPQQRATDLKRVDAQVVESRHGANGVVRVQSA